MTTSGDFRIRPMMESDLEAVVRFAAALPSAPQWSRSMYIAFSAEVSLRRIALVLEADQTDLAGFVVASLTPPEAEIESIAVATNLQRKGLASRLVAELITRLHRREVTELHLEVRTSNHAARKLYASFGFDVFGIRRCYYADPVEDAVLLRLHLTSIEPATGASQHP